MRARKTSDKLTVQAISGSHVVLLGWSLPKANYKNLAGFALHRTDHEEEEAYWLRGMKTFEATDPGLPRGSLHSTRVSEKELASQEFAGSLMSVRIPGVRGIELPTFGDASEAIIIPGTNGTA